MPSIGTFANGDPFVENLSTGPGVKVTSITPQATVLGTDDVHGAMLNPGVGSHGPQGFSTYAYNSGPVIGYDGALNIDPGKTGSAVEFAAGQEGTIVKSVSLDPANPPNDERSFSAIGTITVVGSTVPAGALRPGVANPDKTVKWVEADMIDLSTLPSLPIIAGTPSPTNTLGAIRWKQQQEWPPGDESSSIAAVTNQPRGQYAATDIGPAMAEAIILLCMDIPVATKRDLAVAICQQGIDAFEFLENRTSGMYFGGNPVGRVSLGGATQRGAKPSMVIAGLLLNDANILSWINTPNSTGSNVYFAEDGQIRYLPQSIIDQTQTSISDRPVRQYEQIDLGMPEWSEASWYNGSDGNRHENASYRAITMPYYVLTALAMQLFPGAKAAWNNPALFDLADRYMERDFLKDPADPDNINKWARTVSTNGLSDWEEAVWDAYRAQGDPIWDWPA